MWHERRREQRTGRDGGGLILCDNSWIKLGIAEGTRHVVDRESYFIESH